MFSTRRDNDRLQRAPGDTAAITPVENGCSARALGRMGQLGDVRFKRLQWQRLTLFRTRRSNNDAGGTKAIVPSPIGAAGQSEAAAMPALRCARLCFGSLASLDELSHFWSFF